MIMVNIAHEKVAPKGVIVADLLGLKKILQLVLEV
jgi:hypothetical protein